MENIDRHHYSHDSFTTPRQTIVTPLAALLLRRTYCNLRHLLPVTATRTLVPKYCDN